MSSPKGTLDRYDIEFLKAPQSAQGFSSVKIGNQTLEIRWRKDDEGIWLELPHGVFGFDITTEIGDDQSKAMHVKQRGSDSAWMGLKFLRAGEDRIQSQSANQKKGARIKAQMPGKIVRVNIKPGDAVEKDQSLLVMEAMKMENEIRAPQAGRVEKIEVNEGQAVESGALLLTLS